MYHNIPIHEADKDKTVLITRKGCYRYKVLPFGLTTAPSVFQRPIDLVICGLTYITCLVYIDDIIVFAADFETHLSRLREVFERLRSANLKLHPTKCYLFQQEVDFLGHTLSKAGIEVQTAKGGMIKRKGMKTFYCLHWWFTIREAKRDKERQWVDRPLQRVRIGTNHSSWLQLNGAMSQGSWLGTLTFLLLIDDLQVDCLVHKYVDDTTLTELLQGRNESSNMQDFFKQLILMTWLSISLKQKRWSWAQWHCPPTYPSYNGQRVKSNE